MTSAEERQHPKDGVDSGLCEGGSGYQHGDLNLEIGDAVGAIVVECPRQPTQTFKEPGEKEHPQPRCPSVAKGLPGM